MPVSERIILPKVIRPDIQALRTLAVSLVVLFHLWPNRMPGGFVGVDVFFVISGFLITKHILDEIELGRFSVTAFWARRIKRLLPASFLVLSVTGIGIALFAPVSRWSQWFGEIQSSVFYFENWNLAGASVDYLALSNQASPVQHFWSLSVEEQFYFAWPLLVALALFLSSRGKNKVPSARKTVFSILFAVTVLSFLISVFYTPVEPAIAYFATPVRAWEFGVGALTAFLPRLKNKRLVSTLALVGLTAIFVSAFVINTSTPFPGTAAILPVFGTVLVIRACVQEGWLSKALAIAPAQWLGDKSYAIYLWHWPIIIFVPLITSASLSTVGKIAVLALTLLLSWLTHEFIEKPIARIQIAKWRIFGLAATTSVLIAALSGLAIHSGKQSIENELMFGKYGAVASQPCFGASARLNPDNCADSGIEGVYPELRVATSDIVELPESCFSLSREQIAASYCTLGNSNGSFRIAAVGDSHLAQYAGALSALAIKNNWQVDLYAKGGCPFSFAVRVHDEVLTKNCPAWVKNVVESISTKNYDAIITSQRSGVKWVGGNPAAIDGLSDLWSKLLSQGQKIVAIKDSPNPGQNPVDCLLKNKDCSFVRVAALRFDPQLEAAKNLKTVTLVNFDDVFCDKNSCEPIIGNAVVYRDDNHLTDTFARTLGPLLEPVIQKVLEK